jgi:peptide/nickel transport system permease protein
MKLVLRRLAWSLLVVWFVVTAAFAMVTLIPADPAKAMLGPHATPQAVERVRAHYCLDQGFVGQYGCFLDRLAHGDLGESYRSKRPVGELILERLGPTVQLALATIILQLLIGIPLGIAAVARRGRWPDRAVGVVTLLGQSLPTFFVATLLVYVLAYGIGWFPIGGYGSGVLDRLHHLVLPAFTLATLGIAYYARLVRSELGEQLGEDYIRTARAKGLRERDVIIRHALRNALGPLVALIGIDLGVLLGGAVVTEYIFAWPGLGREVLQAILEVDLPLILGVVLVSAIAVVIANLVGDLVHAWIDPRLRDGS